MVADISAILVAIATLMSLLKSAILCHMLTSRYKVRVLPRCTYCNADTVNLKLSLGVIQIITQVNICWNLRSDNFVPMDFSANWDLLSEYDYGMRQNRKNIVIK